MGIPGFTGWFSDQEKAAYVPLDAIQATTGIDHLYIDANSLLHNAIRNAKSWEHFHKVLHNRLNRILEVTTPKKSVMIAVDGPAPLAKLLTQRERRKKGGNKSAALKKVKKAFKKGGEADESDDESLSVLTSSSITPGTRFMLDITTSLYSWAATKLLSQQRYQHLSIEVSDATVPGEGEVKILGRMRQHWSPSLSPEDVHAIIGDDADLILMAMVSVQSNLLVINSALNDGQMAPTMPVFSVSALHTSWASKLLNQSAHQDPALLTTIKCDLVLLTVICKGNDYLPGVRRAKLEPNGLWEEYKRLVKHSKTKGIVSIDPASGSPSIDLKMLASILGAKNGSASSKGGPLDDDSDNDSMDPLAAAASGVRLDKRLADPKAYLRGLIWLMESYIMGRCPDYRYFYDGHSPSINQLAEACLSFTSSVLSHRDFQLAPGSSEPLLPFASAMALLPSKCAHLLPEAVRPLMSQAQDSLLKEIYWECPTCKELTAEVSAANKALSDKRMEVEAIEAAIKGAIKSGGGSGQSIEAGKHLDELKAKVQAVSSEYEQSKDANRSKMTRRLAHVNSDHPYKPFPIDKLVAASSTIPASSFLPEEQQLTRFGRGSVLMKQDHSSLVSKGQRFNPPPQPFSNNRPYTTRGGPGLTKFLVEEMNDGSYVSLVPHDGKVTMVYLSCPDPANANGDDSRLRGSDQPRSYNQPKGFEQSESHIGASRPFDGAGRGRGGQGGGGRYSAPSRGGAGGGRGRGRSDAQPSPDYPPPPPPSQGPLSPQAVQYDLGYGAPPPPPPPFQGFQQRGGGAQASSALPMPSLRLLTSATMVGSFQPPGNRAPPLPPPPPQPRPYMSSNPHSGGAHLPHHQRGGGPAGQQQHSHPRSSHSRFN